MANQEHVDRLLSGGVEAWNQWRQENPEIVPDLSEVYLTHAELTSIDLNGANLSDAEFSGTSFMRADFTNANFRYANLVNTDLYGVNGESAIFIGANLEEADLGHTNFCGANFSDANLSEANLFGSYLSNANFSNVDLSDVILNSANASNANFSGAYLINAQAISTNFQAAILTGACIEDWHINSHTNLQDVVCEHIFTKCDWGTWQFIDRRPHDPDQIFAPGEFTNRYQIVLETVELFFHDGIDWRAFLASLEEMKAKYGDELNIQGIERKAGGTFLVRLEVPSDADKGVVERATIESYETELKLLKMKYHLELQAKDREIEIYRQQSADILELAKLAATRPINVEATAVADNQSKNTTYNMQGSKYGGGFAAEGGIQIGGTLNDFSQTIEQNKNDIESLIQSLRDLTQAFPMEKREEANVHLDDLEQDIQQPEKRQSNRVRARLAALVAIVIGISGAVATATDFANNLLQLHDRLELPAPPELVHHVSTIDVKAVEEEP